MTAYLAIDLGATSCRVSYGVLSEDRIELVEVSRFPNLPVTVCDSLRWDAPALFRESVVGVRNALARIKEHKTTAISLGIDSWGVDYGHASEPTECRPRSYRDMTAHHVAPVREKISAELSYSATGIEAIHINTIYQLADSIARHETSAAEPILLIPDLWVHWLTGDRSVERTIASTTELMNAASGDWAYELAEKAGIPTRTLPSIVETGTSAGPLLPDIARAVEAPTDFHVVHVAEHDTASAVAAIPATSSSFAFISSGSWSLAGLELRRPILSEEARLAGFTNERGAYGSTLFMRNLSGLWLLEQCIREWNGSPRGEPLTLTSLVDQSRNREGIPTIIDLSHPAFIEPADVLGRIRDYCISTGQRVLVEPADVARCIINSLAVAYRATIEAAESLSGTESDVIHLIGGGSKNSLLCQLAADACERTVMAGPTEASSLGNVLVQAISDRSITGLDDARTRVRNSYLPTRYQPGSPDMTSTDWHGAQRLLADLVDTRSAGAQS